MVIARWCLYPSVVCPGHDRCRLVQRAGQPQVLDTVAVVGPVSFWLMVRVASLRCACCRPCRNASLVASSCTLRLQPWFFLACTGASDLRSHNSFFLSLSRSSLVPVTCRLSPGRPRLSCLFVGCPAALSDSPPLAHESARKRCEFRRFRSEWRRFIGFYTILS